MGLPPTPSRSHPWAPERPSSQPAREGPREESSGAESAPRFRTRALGRGAPASSSCLHPPDPDSPRPLFSLTQRLTAGPSRASDPNHRLTPAPTDSRRPLPRYRVSRGALWSLRNFGLKEKPRTSQSTAFFLTLGPQHHREHWIQLPAGASAVESGTPRPPSAETHLSSVAVLAKNLRLLAGGAAAQF